MAGGRACLQLEDIGRGFDASKHPAVALGVGSEQQVYAEMMDSWDANLDGVVTWEEFRDYFTCVGASVSSDGEFCSMMKAVWSLD